MNVLFLVTLGAFAGVSVVSVKTYFKYRRAKIVADGYRDAYVITMNKIDVQTGQENFKEIREYVEFIEESR